MTESVIPNPVISVVLCTYNNADSLDITLRQLLRQKLPHKDAVELILVNNNSTDHTEQVAFCPCRTFWHCVGNSSVKHLLRRLSCWEIKRRSCHCQYIEVASLDRIPFTTKPPSLQKS
ncbi:MAG: glycosyltransferase [Moraxellaceae bacterium]|nr:MAG: glycosyltransferase [Moraxellaceae bacterium]